MRANRELAALVTNLQRKLANRDDELVPDSALIGVLSGFLVLSIIIWMGRMIWMTRHPGLVFCFDR